MQLDALQWMITYCTGGFLFLAGWMFWLVGELSRKVSYEWIEKQLKAELNGTLTEIRDAMLGTMQQEGLISRMRRIEDRCALHVQEKLHEKIDEKSDAR